MTLEENLADLRGHAADFAARTGFTYTVLDPDGDTVIGCVYIYPPRGNGSGPRRRAEVRSWVRASHAHLDRPVHAAVSDWLAERWPFQGVDYAARNSLDGS